MRFQKKKPFDKQTDHFQVVSDFRAPPVAGGIKFRSYIRSSMDGNNTEELSASFSYIYRWLVYLIFIKIQVLILEKYQITAPST